MSGELRGLVTAIALSKATMRNIKQNLVLAFGYNVAAIPVAAGLLYPFTGAAAVAAHRRRRDGHLQRQRGAQQRPPQQFEMPTLSAVQHRGAPALASGALR